MSLATINAQEWISALEAAKILGIQRDRIEILHLKGLITSREIPGTRVKYLRADVERLAAECIKPARAAV